MRLFCSWTAIPLLTPCTIIAAIYSKLTIDVSAPGRPCIIPEDCSAVNNSVTVAWQPYPNSVVEAYSLELDDGHEGDFRVS